MDCTITKDEIETQRTVEEFLDWVDAVIERFKSSKQCREYFRTNKTTEIKRFREETFALYYLFKNCETINYSIKIIQKTGSQNYDAKILENKDEEFIEITHPLNGKAEKARMKQLSQAGHVPASGEVYKKTKDKQYVFDGAPKDEHSIVEQKDIIALIKDALSKKSSKNYPEKTSLLIYLDKGTHEEDFTESFTKEVKELDAFIEEHKLIFNSVFLVSNKHCYLKKIRDSISILYK